MPFNLTVTKLKDASITYARKLQNELNNEIRIKKKMIKYP